tara:strand:+ start:3162 stop:3815 length:654 start_codon:yes stop_codon:yes gene_type:complete
MTSKFKVIILDFDGTLVESIGIKDRAFRALFSGHPDHLPEIMAYHISHNSVLRFEKFRHIYENILKRPYTHILEFQLSAAFHEFVFKELIACPEVTGASAFLTFFHGVVPIYLVSKSPDYEFNQVIKARGLQKFFNGIFPGSWDKADAIRHILRREELMSPEAVFIGDTKEDQAVAEATNVAFIGRNSGRPFDGYAVTVFSDMHQIYHHITASEDVT